MKGYIVSLHNSWRHIFKRAVKPGGKIKLEELYNDYGKKYDIDEKEFVDWLKKVKLKDDAKMWDFILDDDIKIDEHIECEDNSVNIITRKDLSGPSKKRYTAEEIVDFSVRKAREIIPNIKDIRTLKYAYEIAKQRAQKESLSRILDKRIKELL